MQTRIHTCAHRRQHWSLGEHLGVRPDAHFKILAPRVLSDEHVLHMLRLGRARLQLGQVGADHPRHLGPDCRRRIRVAARALLDHPLQHRHGERDSSSLDDL